MLKTFKSVSEAIAWVYNERPTLRSELPKIENALTQRGIHKTSGGLILVIDEYDILG